MIVYLQREQVQECLRTLDGGSTASYHHQPVLACSFDDQSVVHVHTETADGLTKGAPREGLLVSVPLPSDVELPLTNLVEKWPMLREALRDVRYDQSGFIVVLCAPTNDPSNPAVRAYSFAPQDNTVTECDTRFVPGQAEVFDRARGVLETSLINDKRVAIIGVGSGGSICAVELAKCGIGQFDLVDFDRLELHNVMRHCCGVSDLGRYKTLAVRDLLLDKNPYCQVRTYEQDVVREPDILDAIVAEADLVIAGTDNNDSRREINKACIRHNKVCLYGRLMLRASGGDVLRVRPGLGPCYECVMQVVWRHQPEEISQPAQAEAASYADRPVVAEPGLSNDIYPVATMMVKLGIQELIRGTGAGLESLDEDLVSDLYLWANRREEQYAGWFPMKYSMDGLAVLRWYGIRISRNPQCPACGQFVPEDDISAEDMDFFESPA